MDPEDYEWASGPTIERRARYLMHGTSAGYPATAWDDADAPFDGRTEPVAREITETISGTVLGEYPDLGTVTSYSDGPTTTDVEFVTVKPVEFFDKK